MRHAFALAFAIAASLPALTSCGPKLLVNSGDPNAPNVCVRTLTGDVQVPKQQAADILIVVDNSGSMQEEQANLVANFLNTDPSQCPLQDLKNIPPEFKNPAAALYTGDGPLAKCGFVQLVAAFDNDFRIGVVTTDVGLCDNKISSAQGGAAWGYRPQRGCLHGDGPPGTGEHKVIARADLDDDDPTNDDLAARFDATLQNIGTFGSTIERGLDAMNIFLDPGADKNPQCTGDLDLFRRPDASLVVIFLSDEDDCSHGLGDSLTTFGNENVGEVCGEFPDGLTAIKGSKCYTDQADLSATTDYVAPLLALDPQAKVAVIAGANAASQPAGCIVGANGAPEAGDDVCFQSGGLSNENGAGPQQPCGPDTAAARGGLPCCTADEGGRYFAFADEITRKATNSICNASFRSTMIDIAAFIAAVDEVELAEPPENPNLIVVELTRADGSKLTLDPVPDSEDCATTDGFRLENETHVVLCGAARGAPGDSIVVKAAGESQSVACNSPFLEASGGGANCSSTSTSLCGTVSALALALLALRRRRRTHREPSPR
jgi:uncharacterized protein (TIGR03382 family)